MYRKKREDALDRIFCYSLIMNSLEYTPPPLEKSPALPTGFAELREKILALTQKPLEERFANEPEELARLTSLSEKDLGNFIKNGEKPGDADIEKYKQEVIARRTKTCFESELMDILMNSSLDAKDGDNSPENLIEKPFDCMNEKCLGATNLVKGVYRGYDDGENLSGDIFRVTQNKIKGGTQTDMLLIDAQGHGGGAAPLALLTASFLEAAEKEGVKNPLLALDDFISSLPLNRSEVSLQKIQIENRDEDAAKTLSITQAGEVYVFWVEGGKNTGWKLKIVAPEKFKSNDGLEPVTLGEGSQLGAIGYGIAGLVSGTPTAHKISVPKDADIFLSSDGIFDSVNPKNEKRLIEELPEIIARVFTENTGAERQQMEENLAREIKELSEKYRQTDDETFFKIAA